MLMKESVIQCNSHPCASLVSGQTMETWDTANVGNTHTVGFWSFREISKKKMGEYHQTFRPLDQWQHIHAQLGLLRQLSVCWTEAQPPHIHIHVQQVMTQSKCTSQSKTKGGSCTVVLFVKREDDRCIIWSVAPRGRCALRNVVGQRTGKKTNTTTKQTARMRYELWSYGTVQRPCSCVGSINREKLESTVCSLPVRNVFQLMMCNKATLNKTPQLV